MDFKAINRKRKSDDKPLCKYGSSCYQKNKEHHKKYRHPSTKDVTDTEDVNANSLCDSPKITPVKAGANNSADSAKLAVKAKRNVLASPKVTPVKAKPKIGDSSEITPVKMTVNNDAVDSRQNRSVATVSSNGNNEETVESILKTMPKDFFDFWSFCSLRNQSRPEDAFSEFGIQLVGIYDLLSKKLPADYKVDISCHWRYYYDPPEFQTVIKRDGDDLYHIGYFRDDPSEMPSILASNKAALGGKLILEGDNIFAAIFSALEEAEKSTKSKDLKSKIKKVKKEVEDFANKKKYNIEVETGKTKKRQKKVVAKTFNGLGIVVPVKNDIGYRSLPDSDAVIKNLLKKIVSCKDEAQRLDLEEPLDEIISNIHFANDECDFGMGLEFGIDLFCYGDPSLDEYILRTLPLAYKLLQRPKYAEIVEAHLKNRKKGSDLSTLDV